MLKVKNRQLLIFWKKKKKKNYPEDCDTIKWNVSEHIGQMTEL